MRTERSRTYVNADTGGYLTKLSTAPVHVPEAAGGRSPVDLTLVDAGQGRLRPQAAPVQVTFPADLADPVPLSRGQDVVELALRGAASGSAARQGRAASADRASYRLAVPGVDVAVQATLAGAKQIATLAGPSSPRRFANCGWPPDRHARR